MDLFAVIGWPVIDRIGPVSPHGLGIAVGYLAGSWWMLREGRKRGVNEDHVGTILLWALIGAIIGARLFYVLGHLEDFQSIWEMLRIWEGGISLIGGIAGGVGFAYPVLRRYGYRFLQVMDSAAIGLAFGIFVGRIGDLVIGDHLGKPTDFPLGWQYKGGELPGPWSGTEATGWIAPLEEGLVQQITLVDATLCRATPDGFGCAEIVQQGPAVHQTALYDFLIAFGLFLLLRWLGRRPRREGVMIMSFAILYGAGRVLTDFLRVDKTWFGLGLTGSQLTAIGVIVLSVFTLVRFSRRPLPAALPVEEVGEPPPPTPAPLDAPEDAAVGRPGATTVFTPPREPGSEPRETAAPERPATFGVPSPSIPQEADSEPTSGFPAESGVREPTSAAAPEGPEQSTGPSERRTTEPATTEQERPAGYGAPTQAPGDEPARPTPYGAPTEPPAAEQERPPADDAPAESGPPEQALPPTYGAPTGSPRHEPDRSTSSSAATEPDADEPDRPSAYDTPPGPEADERDRPASEAPSESAADEEHRPSAPDAPPRRPSDPDEDDRTE